MAITANVIRFMSILQIVSTLLEERAIAEPVPYLNKVGTGRCATFRLQTGANSETYERVDPRLVAAILSIINA